LRNVGKNTRQVILSMTFEKCGKKHKTSQARSEALEKTHVSKQPRSSRCLSGNSKLNQKRILKPIISPAIARPFFPFFLLLLFLLKNPDHLSFLLLLQLKLFKIGCCPKAILVVILPHVNWVKRRSLQNL
jgi:hypothetical protein